jgi:hypothetical protein
MKVSIQAVRHVYDSMQSWGAGETRDDYSIVAWHVPPTPLFYTPNINSLLKHGIIILSIYHSRSLYTYLNWACLDSVAPSYPQKEAGASHTWLPWATVCLLSGMCPSCQPSPVSRHAHTFQTSRTFPNVDAVIGLFSQISGVWQSCGCRLFTV